jgi:hypothetical protein
MASHALPKFESYCCSRNHLNFLAKVSVAYEQFHGIGCLVHLWPRRPSGPLVQPCGNLTEFHSIRI